jgi:hypothetical protein
MAGGEPLTLDQIVDEIVSAKNFEAADLNLRAAISDRVGGVLFGLLRRGEIVRIGDGRDARWKLID